MARFSDVYLWGRERGNSYSVVKLVQTCGPSFTSCAPSPTYKAEPNRSNVPRGRVRVKRGCTCTVNTIRAIVSIFYLEAIECYS